MEVGFGNNGAEAPIRFEVLEYPVSSRAISRESQHSDPHADLACSSGEIIQHVRIVHSFPWRVWITIFEGIFLAANTASVYANPFCQEITELNTISW
jgi:hypothetical protein